MTIANNIRPQQPQRRQLSLASATTTLKQQPLRVLLYGPEGIGKSTFGAHAPSPFFLCPEEGLVGVDPTPGHMPDGVRDWTEVLDVLRMLADDAHPYKTVVIDTLDWIEPFVWKHCCQRDRKTNIEDYGYGKGYVAALDEWRIFVSALEHCRRKRGLHVVLLAHAHVKPHKMPDVDAYDRWTLKIHDKAGGLLKEWSDAVLFANYETFTTKDGLRVKGVGGGGRIVHTQRRAAWDAKNRFGLTERIPLDWEEFFACCDAAGPEHAQRCEQARADLRALLARTGDATKTADAEAWIARTGDNLAALEAAINKLAAKTAASTDEATATTKEESGR